MATQTLPFGLKFHRVRLVVHLPADEATATGLDRLAGRRPGALRSARAG